MNTYLLLRSHPLTAMSLFGSYIGTALVIACVVDPVWFGALTSPQRAAWYIAIIIGCSIMALTTGTAARLSCTTAPYRTSGFKRGVGIPFKQGVDTNRSTFFVLYFIFVLSQLAVDLIGRKPVVGATSHPQGGFIVLMTSVIPELGILLALVVICWLSDRRLYRVAVRER